MAASLPTSRDAPSRMSHGETLGLQSMNWRSAVPTSGHGSAVADKGLNFINEFASRSLIRDEAQVSTGRACVARRAARG